MTSSAFAEKAELLGVEVPTWRIEPTSLLVQAFEREYSLSLPEDYRDFLAVYGGVTLNATCSFLEPTPFGQIACIDEFYGFMPANRSSSDVRRNTEIIEGAPDVVAIAADQMGGMIWLKCIGEDRGYVYYHDPNQRWCWSDEEFYRRFPAMSPEIKEYLTLRGKQLLPKKPKGYENVYVLAKSFSELIGRLGPETTVEPIGGGPKPKVISSWISPDLRDKVMGIIKK